MGDGQPRLLDQVRDWIRRKHYSIRTEQAYVDWIRRFVLHHNNRPRCAYRNREFILSLPSLDYLEEYWEERVPF